MEIIGEPAWKYRTGVIRLPKHRILIVDDHEVVRLGLSALVSRQADFEVVGEAGSVAEATTKTEELRPDLVIMDIRLPDGSGIEACRDICSRYPGIKVLMLTSFADDEAVFSAIMAGAAGYVLKQIGSHSLLNALGSLARGESLLDPSITGKVLNRIRAIGKYDAGLEDHLTAQERRILSLIAEGKTNKEIAQEIFLSEKTVRNYVSSILGKLNVSHRSQAAAFAVAKNLTDASQEK